MRSAHIRLLSGALAALWLALPVATAVHGAAEVHEYCVEHQAFEHGADAPLGAAGSTIATGDVTSFTAVADADAHEACAFEQALLRDAPQPAAATTATRLTLTSFSHHAFVAQTVAARDVLASAPKTSPPSLLTV